MIEQVREGTFLQNAGTHAHVPLFYVILLPFWYLSHKSVITLRIIMVLLGILSIILTFLLAKKIINEKGALLTSFLLAVSPFHLIYSQHLRAYILLMVLFLAATLIILKYIETNNRILMIPLTLIFISAFYVHLFAAFFVVTQFIILFIVHKKERIKIKPVIASAIITCISWIAWVPIFLKQFQFNITEGGIKTISTLNPIHVPYVLYKYAVAMDFSYAVRKYIYVIILASVLCLLVLYASFKLYTESKKNFIILIGSLVLPIVLLAIIGIFFPVFSFRYVSYLVPIFMMLLAKGIMEIKNKKIRVGMIVITIIIWCIILEVYWSIFTQYKWGYEFAI